MVPNTMKPKFRKGDLVIHKHLNAVGEITSVHHPYSFPGQSSSFAYGVTFNYIPQEMQYRSEWLEDNLIPIPPNSTPSQIEALRRIISCGS